MRFHVCSVGAVALLALITLSSRAGELAPQLRRPIALQVSDDDKWLYVANRRSGTISSIDIVDRSIAAEVAVGRLSDLQPAGAGRYVATDEDSHELLLLKSDGAALTVEQRVEVSPYPVSVVVADDALSCVVASLWSRRLTFIKFHRDAEDGDIEATVSGSLDMPFAPRCQLLVKDESRLIVADSFGGRLAVVGVAKQQLLHVRTFPGHNIRGLGVSGSGEMLLIAHQMLNELAHTVRNDVHWGLLMSNDLRWLKLDAVLDADADLYEGAHMHPLGHAGSATGDPSGMTVTTDGSVVVSLGGVGEVAVGKEDDFSLQRIPVGRRPTALAASHDGRFVYVANTFDDSISIIDVDSRDTLTDISLGEQEELTLADRGELLFFDASLSHDSWMSCHSCHTDGHTNGLLNDNFSDKSFGAPKRVMSLLGRTGTAPFAWNASADTFADQIRRSIQNTMQSDDPADDDQVAALAAFVSTLQTPPPIDVARGERDEAAVKRGGAVFAARKCTNCHAPPVYTTPETYDVGLVDKLGNREFNPPPLRGVGQRGPYFHDGRAKTLEDIFLKHRHRLDTDLTPEELRDLVAFLKSL